LASADRQALGIAQDYLLSEIAGQKWDPVDARKKLPFPGERMHTFETFFQKEETSS